MGQVKIFGIKEKLHLIEDVLKIKSEAVLTEVETVVRKAMRPKVGKESAHDFSDLSPKKISN